MATRTPPRGEKAAPVKVAPAVGGSSKDQGATPARIAAVAPLEDPPAGQRQGYVMPVVHVQLSERVVNIGFWATLAGATALGAVDLPLAVLIGGAVVVARHHARPAS